MSHDIIATWRQKEKRLQSRVACGCLWNGGFVKIKAAVFELIYKFLFDKFSEKRVVIGDKLCEKENLKY